MILRGHRPARAKSTLSPDPHRALGALLARLTDGARLLPAATPANASAERARAVGALERRVRPSDPRWVYRVSVDFRALQRDLDDARQLAGAAAEPELHLERLAELELEVELLRTLPDRDRSTPLAARRHATPQSALGTGETVLERALRWLTAPPPEPVSAEVDPAAAARALRRAAAAAGMDVDVRMDSNLASLAAAGDRTVFLAPRRLSRRQVLRLCAHEVLGHLVSAFNGRTQPLRLLELGTAGSFEDQEGLCLWLEQQAGTFDSARRRTLAARVLVADAFYRGHSFGQACELAFEILGQADDAVRAAERTYRGGGAAARDVGYLLGLDRVERLRADCGATDLALLRAGRIATGALPAVRRLLDVRLARSATLQPDTASALGAALRELPASAMPGRTPREIAPPAAEFPSRRTRALAGPR